MVWSPPGAAAVKGLLLLLLLLLVVTCPLATRALATDLRATSKKNCAIAWAYLGCASWGRWCRKVVVFEKAHRRWALPQLLSLASSRARPDVGLSLVASLRG